MTELMARITMATNRHAIMTFVTRSTPFCRPRPTMKKPMPQIMTIQNSIWNGSASSAENACSAAPDALAEADAPSPVSWLVAILNA